MKSKSVFAILAFAAMAGANAAETIELRNIVDSHVLTLPAPTGWWGAAPRKPVVRDMLGQALLDFGTMAGPLGGAFAQPYHTSLEYLHGVRDVQAAKAHFKLVHGIDLDRPPTADENPRRGGPEELSYPYGRVLVVDLGRMGWIPGNRYYYFFLGEGREQRTVYMGPTWYMAYDLGKVRFERDLPRSR